MVHYLPSTNLAEPLKNIPSHQRGPDFFPNNSSNHFSPEKALQCGEFLLPFWQSGSSHSENLTATQKRTLPR